MVEGNRRIVAELVERHIATGYAIGLARSAGVPVGAQRQGKFQFRIHSEFVLEIEAHAIEGQRL